MSIGMKKIMIDFINLWCESISNLASVYLDGPYQNRMDPKMRTVQKVIHRESDDYLPMHTRKLGPQ